ncbi:hypothetical protein P9112_009991 [Eukaryota sp. TZLM1-RC]
MITMKNLTHQGTLSGTTTIQVLHQSSWVIPHDSLPIIKTEDWESSRHLRKNKANYSNTYRRRLEKSVLEYAEKEGIKVRLLTSNSNLLKQNEHTNISSINPATNKPILENIIDDSKYLVWHQNPLSDVLAAPCVYRHAAAPGFSDAEKVVPIIGDLQPKRRFRLTS